MAVRELGVRKANADGQSLLPALGTGRIAMLVACHDHTKGLVMSSALFSFNLGVGHNKATRRGNVCLLEPRT